MINFRTTAPTTSEPFTLDWSIVGAIATIVGVAVAIFIAYVVQQSTKKSAVSQAALAADIRDLTRRGRIFSILLTLSESRKKTELLLALNEGRTIAEGKERYAVELNYFTNPHSEWVQKSSELRGITREERIELVEAVIEALPNRYPNGSLPQSLAADLGGLTSYAHDVGAKTYKIAGFLVGRAIDGTLVDEADIRSILSSAGRTGTNVNMAAAPDYIYLMEEPLSDSAFIHLLNGVCLAVIDTSGPLTTHIGNRSLAGIESAFALICHRDNLKRLGSTFVRTTGSDRNDALESVGFVMKALSIVTTEGWETERILQSVPILFDSFPAQSFANSGRSGENLKAGVTELVRKHGTSLPHLTDAIEGRAANLFP